jgi:hypothetical protein
LPLANQDARTVSDLYGNDVIDRIIAGETIIWPPTRHMPLVAYSLVREHPFRSGKVLRLCPSETPRLLLVDNRRPSDRDCQIFADVCNWVKGMFEPGSEMITWWEWQEGDVLIPDLISMVHGVRGGFNVGERIFTGRWAYESNDHVIAAGKGKFDPNRIDPQGNLVGYWDIGDVALNEAACWNTEHLKLW